MLASDISEQNVLREDQKDGNKSDSDDVGDETDSNYMSSHDSHSDSDENEDHHPNI